MLFYIHQIARVEFEMRNARLIRPEPEGAVVRTENIVDRLLARLRLALAARRSLRNGRDSAPVMGSASGK